MKTKICSKCSIEKPGDEIHFPKDRGKLAARCKICKSEYHKQWRLENQEKKKKQDKEYGKKYRRKNAKKFKNKGYKKKKSNYNATYWNENKEKIRTRRQKNRKRENELRNNKRNKQRKVDPMFRLKERIRGMLYKSFKNNGYTKKRKTCDILGCSFEEFKNYLESKFESWMNWENKGLYNGEFNFGWDIDHTIPLNTAKTERDIIKLNHYTNLQPLCSKVNRDIKRDNVKLLK